MYHNVGGRAVGGIHPVQSRYKSFGNCVKTLLENTKKMRVKILSIMLVGILAILIACNSTRTQSEGEPNRSLLAQTNPSAPMPNKKQGSKLYPYFLDYPVELSIEGNKLNALLAAVDNFRQD